jgi:iron-sulfur cluster assembly accessory protein
LLSWAAGARDSATRWRSVFIDQASLLYLDGAEVDYVENMEGSGFKFNNPNVKSTCGCGSSFSA